jgi:hypothetical protein
MYWPAVSYVSVDGGVFVGKERRVSDAAVYLFRRERTFHPVPWLLDQGFFTALSLSKAHPGAGILSLPQAWSR